MSDPKPNPTLNAEGLPLCSEDACALYDGKRCRAIGFRPGTYCEPALVALVEKAKGAERPQVSAVPDSMLYVMEIGDEVPMDAFVRMKNAAAALQKSWAEQWRGPGICPSIIVTRPSTRVYPASLPPDVAALIAERDALKTRVADLERRPSPVEHAARMAAMQGKTLGAGGVLAALVAGQAASAATTIEQAPPDDLLDQTRCPHRRVSLRPDAHGNPETTCLDCGEPTNP